MNTTIRQLAMQWFNPLSSAEKTRLVDTNFELFGGVRRWETLTGSEMENIFYNEVILKWGIVQIPNIGYCEKDELIKIYLKEHSKLKKVLREVDIDVSFELSKEREEEIDNLMKEHSKEEPKTIYWGKDACMYDGEHSQLTSASNRHLCKLLGGTCDCVIEEVINPIDNPILYRTVFDKKEQPLSVNKDVEVDEELNYHSSNLVTEKKEAIEFADYLLGNFEMSEFEKEHPKYKVDDELCWQLAGTQQKYTTVEMYEIWLNEPKITQPKVEDNSWDEVVKEFIKHIQFDKVESQTIELINWIKQHYTLIKKQ
jgi:hypothetical protein